MPPRPSPSPSEPPLTVSPGFRGKRFASPGITPAYVVSPGIRGKRLAGGLRLRSGEANLDPQAAKVGFPCCGRAPKCFGRLADQG